MTIARRATPSAASSAIPRRCHGAANLAAPPLSGSMRRTIVTELTRARRREHARGGKNAGVLRNQHASASRELASVLARERSGAAERHQRKVARVVSTLDRDDSQGSRSWRHSLPARCHSARFGAEEARAAAPVPQSRSRRGRDQAHVARRGSAPRRDRSSQVRIGDGRRRAASVAGWAGIGTGAFRTHLQRSAGVTTCNRSAPAPTVWMSMTGTRRAIRSSVQSVRRGIVPAISCDVGGRATHVDGEHTIETKTRRQSRDADDAASRTGGSCAPARVPRAPARRHRRWIA